MLEVTLLSAGAVLLSTKNNAAMADTLPTGAVSDPRSPATTPFLQELPRMPAKTALPGGVKDLCLPENGGVAPNGTVYPQIAGKDAATTYRNSLERIVALQQRNSANNIQFPPKRYYALDVRQAKHVFHPEGPYKKGSVIWGYDGLYPGPTFMNRYGVPILVRIFNRLFDDTAANGFTPGIPTPGGFGNPQISTHLHNGHTGSESDGNPADIYPPTKPDSESPQYPPSIMAIRFRDHHYGMFRAGLNPRRTPTMPPPNVNDGDGTETLSTLWYHDHSMEHTAENVYKGLVGFHLFFDEVDSGDENDKNPGALRLPSGEFDIPLLFQDKRFDANGQLILDPLSLNHDGFLGDKYVVNGAIQPKLTVLRRKYRFRLLNAGPSRFYQFFLTKFDVGAKQDIDQTFKQIGNDESLLEKPVDVTSVLLAVAERADVIIDFSRFKKGDQLHLVNRLVMQSDGTGPDYEMDKDGDFVKFKVLPQGQGDQILRFVVGEDAKDPSRVPAELRKNPPLPKWADREPNELKKLKVHKIFEFTKSAAGEWVINTKPFDTSPSIMIRQNPLPGDEIENPPLVGDDDTRRPDGEVWTIKNSSDSTWSHPIHIHIEEFRILWRKGVKTPAMKPPSHERCRKDVLRINPQEEVQIFLRFRDFLGKYPIHCHNVLHEDMAMMLRFDVVGAM
jgi:FtsP/CotA-like multicopper oxidase with cupredoxin domain